MQRGVQPVNHEYDYKQNWMTQSPDTNLSLLLQFPQTTNTLRQIYVVETMSK